MPDPSETRGDLWEYYARRVPEYDRIYERPERQGDLGRLEHWVAEALRDRSVLELACGTGYWTRLVGRVARDVLATDVDAASLVMARRRGASGTVRFARLDAFALPFRSTRFTGAFAGFWWSHVPRARMAGFLRALHAVLAPGARIVFVDNRYVEGSSTPLAGTAPGGDTYQIRVLSDGSKYRIIKNFPTRDDVRLPLAGLARDVRFAEWTYYWAVSYRVAAP